MMKGIQRTFGKGFSGCFFGKAAIFSGISSCSNLFILTGKTGTTFIAVYIPSVMAIYSGNTISYDENGHGYTYLFSLPVNKKYMSEKNIFYLLL